MDKKNEKKSIASDGILRLRRNKPAESAPNQQTTNNIIPPSKKDITPVPAPSSPLVPKPDFKAIYNELHDKFPQIINMASPVLLAIGIRKDLSAETGISGVILHKWIAWYCRKSNYYAKHQQGATRFHLDGSAAGIVTKEHQENMDKKLEKAKLFKSTLKSKNMGSGDNPADSLISTVATNK